MIVYKVVLQFDHRAYKFDFFTAYVEAISFATTACKRYQDRDNIQLTAMVIPEKKEDEL